MKYFEIIFKILFLIGSIYSIKLGTLSHPYMIYYLGISLILGFTLCFNKKQSYGYELVEREIMMRRIEGALLILFALSAFALTMEAAFRSWS